MGKPVPNRGDDAGNDQLSLQLQANRRLLGDDEAVNDTGIRGFAPNSGVSSPHIYGSDGTHGFRGDATAAVTYDQQDGQGMRGTPANAQRKKHSFLRRVGKRAWGLGALSIIAIAAALGFLSWLWYGSRDEERWRRLMLGGWSNQAVTISGLVLRTSTSLLAGIATSMLASIALEQRRGVPLRDAVRLSAARFTNPSPDTFWHETLFRQHFVAFPLRLLLLLLLLSTLAIQFSSTILLSDLGMGRVVGFPSHSTNSTGFSWLNAEFGLYEQIEGTEVYLWNADFKGHNVPFQSRQDYWSGQPRASHVFAEYSEPESRITDRDEVEDTGMMLRSFLPIGDQNIRNNLRNFTGVAPVFDTRVMCVRPEFVEGGLLAATYNITFRMPSLSGDGIPGLTTTIEDFTVQLPRVTGRRGHGWLLYPLSPSVGGLLSTLDAASLQGLDLTWVEYDDEDFTRFSGRVPVPGVWRSSGEHRCGVNLGNAYVLMDTRGTGLQTSAVGRPIKVGDGRGPWLTLDVGENHNEDFPDHDVNSSLGEVTICFDSLPKGAQYHHIQDFEITASGTVEHSEPVLDFRAAAEDDDILALREQLGASNTEEERRDRGRSVLRLDSIDSIRDVVDRSSAQWKEYCISSWEIESIEQEVQLWHPNIYNTSTYSWVKEMAVGVTLPISLCTGNCIVNVDGTGEVPEHIRSSRGMAWIVDETIRHAGLPSVAISAVLTQALREAYYTWFPTFDEMSELEIVEMETVLVPLRFRGLWIVYGITLLHFSLCLVTFVAFASLTETSCLNNGWQAMADVINHEDGRRVLEKAGHMKDDEVEKWMKANPNLHGQFTVRGGREKGE